MSVATVWAHLPTLGGVPADPAPSPSPSTQVPDELEVTPGLAGFLATFAVAVACVLLFLSLTRHLRRATHNAEERGMPVDERRTIRPRRRGEPSGGAPDDGAAGTGPGGTPDDEPPDPGGRG